MNRLSALAVLLAVAVALVLRVPRLDTRPFHNDEAVNAIKVAELWEHGRYKYDPDEYHGPTLHYATLPILWLSGARDANELSDATLRVAPVVFGVGLILLLLLFVDGLGRQAAFWAALFIAISPAMVFYSRYFIHEMLLVFFTALTLGAGWRCMQTRRVSCLSINPTAAMCNPRRKSVFWAALAGAGLGLMFATKETFVLTVTAIGLAGIATFLWSVPKENRLDYLRNIWSGKHATIVLGTTLFVWLLFFSSFFTNFAGLLDSVRTYIPWLTRAGGHSPHIHPWHFYLERLAWFHPPKSPVWSEGLVLALALGGIVASLGLRATPLHRFLTLYTLVLAAIYGAIPYKTPWCLLNFHLGVLLLAGVGAAALVESVSARPARLLTIVAVSALTLELSWQSWRASFAFAADRRNPYVYAQTVPDLLNLVRRTEGIARVAPEQFQTVVKVIAPESDYWPLPWYLRRFQNVGWYDRLPGDPFAPIVIVSSKLDARLDDKSDRKWIMVGLTEMRPGTFFEQYVELELWKKYVETLPRERD